MQVLIADPLSQETLLGLESLGVTVRYEPDLNPLSLASSLKGVTCLVVGKTRVNRSVIEAADCLEAILHAGVGSGSIDLEAASERGIVVSHCHDSYTAARAELAFGMVLSLDRQLRDSSGVHGGYGLRGRTFGIVGWDPLGEALAAVAKAFRMRVAVFADSLTPTLAAEKDLHWYTSVEELGRASDVLSLHPADGTACYLDAEALEALGSGAVLLNMEAAESVDLVALKARLDAGTLKFATDAYAASDYGERVPFQANDYPHVFASYRQGEVTEQAAESINHCILHAVEYFLATRLLPGAINLSTAVDASVVRITYRLGAEALAALFDTLRNHDVKVYSFENDSFAGHKTGRITLQVAQPITAKVEEELKRLAGVLSVQRR